VLAALLSADLLDKLARIPAGRARKTLGLDSDFAFGADNNLISMVFLRHLRPLG